VNEAARLGALLGYNVLDTPPEPSFDRITAMVCRVLDVPISLVGLIDDERQWFKSCVGLGATQTDRDVTFCSYTILDDATLVVPDATKDPRFAENPAVTGEPFVRAYAGAPLITPDGFRIGTLCAIGMKPREFTATQLATLRDLSAVVIDELELRRHSRLFEKITTLAPNMVYMMDLRSRRVTWKSRPMQDLLGFELDDLTLEGLSVNMPPDEAKRAAANLERALGLPDGQIHETTYRVHGAGGQRWMLVRSTPFSRDPGGKLTELLCVATDVSPLKLAEQRVQESEQALAGRVEVLEAILETAGEGILVADENAQIIIANPLARDVTGRMPGDSLRLELNKNLARNFYEPDGESPFPAEKLPLVNALRGIPSNNVEMMVKTPAFPDGVYLMSTGRPVVDREGVVRGGVVTLSDVTALRRMQDRLAELAITDELTRLPNRRALRDRLELLAAEAHRGRRFSLAIVDIDHFKNVNDTHGHAIGDEVLIAVAKTLRDSIRRSDMVARMGDEEFCVLQTDIDSELMTMLTERLRAAVEAIAEPVRITASFGVCHSSKTIEPTALLQHADQALYAAKRDGRNRVVVA